MYPATQQPPPLPPPMYSPMQPISQAPVPGTFPMPQPGMPMMPQGKIFFPIQLGVTNFPAMTFHRANNHFLRPVVYLKISPV